ncbi:MAG TPA: hypothetical protein VHQ01_11875 [Pyrinomonadaceae bacterium]|nr:hypothetical protein [Pyrinomonadaceae bacterium]
MKIEPGETVIAIMHSPREKLLGRLEDISPAGISMRAIELGYFDDWCQSIASGEPHLSMTDYFFPMWRVERISRDDNGDLPSMSEQFESRTGERLGDQ